MTGTSRLLQRARLALPFTARYSKGRLVRGQQCVVTQYTLFAAREACDLCDRPQQAERQVLIEAGGRTFRAGLNCLEDVSGITPRAMEQAVQGHLGVALRLRNMSAQGFADERAMLDQILQVIDRFGTNKELAGLRKEILRLQTVASFRVSEMRWLEQAVDFLAVLDGHYRQPERHARMLDAVWGHPGVRARDSRSRLDRSVFEHPHNLTVTQVTELRRVLNELRTVEPQAHWSDSVVPWDHATQEGYRTALAAQFQAQADAGQIKSGHLQLQYDLVHLQRQPARLEDVTTNVGVPCVLPIYQHPAITGLGLRSELARRALETSNRLPRLALDDQTARSFKVHTALVRTDHPDRRQDNHGRERPAQPENVVEVTYQCVAFWRPDAWHPVYALWLTHGRDELLSFPVLGR